jgi:hypothetical protein
MKITVVKKGTAVRKPQLSCPWWLDDIVVENRKQG